MPPPAADTPDGPPVKRQFVMEAPVQFTVVSSASSWDRLVTKRIAPRSEGLSRSCRRRNVRDAGGVDRT